MSKVEPDFQKSSLLPAIVQDYKTKEVLMLAYVNKEAWEKTLATGDAHYFSRSRQKIWHKGETSGHVQKIKEIRIDCDLDTILYIVEQVGGASCHEGYESCFYRRFLDNGDVEICSKKVFNPEEVYKNG
ncbi:MAG: phosphoribosyl-AMP cyclohydrolase [Desulfonauticus sp.]|nr:phosphoribosyl-AMP cyclohydrolase [Desulfonauticus sp.]